MTQTAPTSDEIKKHLLERAQTFAERRGLSLATVSTLCAGDGKFLSAVRDGSGFTVARYQRAMEWLEQNMPESET